MKYCLLHLWVAEEEKFLVLEVAVVVLEFVDDVISELTVEVIELAKGETHNSNTSTLYSFILMYITQ